MQELRIYSPHSGCGKKYLTALIVLFVVLLGSAAFAKDKAKPTNDECLACHSDPAMSTEVNGKQVSLHVNPDAFKASIHGAMFTNRSQPQQ